MPPCSDRTNPKEWYLPKNLYELPPETELEKTPAENIAVSARWSNALAWWRNALAS